MTDKYVEKSKLFTKMMLYGFRAPDMTVTEFVDDLPVADVKEVKHAKWVDGVCSNCGTKTPITTVYYHGELVYKYEGKMNLCPNCGAIIQKEETDDIAADIDMGTITRCKYCKFFQRPTKEYDFCVYGEEASEKEE